MSQLNPLVYKLPLNLTVRQSGLPGANYSVWCEKDIPEGMRFGPYEAVAFGYKRHLNDSAFQEGIPSGEKTSSDQDELTLNWLGYINCTCDIEQQNLIMYSCQGQIFCISTKNVPAGTELLVWHFDKSEGVTSNSSFNNIESDEETLVKSAGENISKVLNKTASVTDLSETENHPQMAGAYSNLQHATVISTGSCKEKSSKKFEDGVGNIMHSFHFMRCQTLNKVAHSKCSKCQRNFTQLYVFDIDYCFLARNKNYRDYGASNNLKQSYTYTENNGCPNNDNVPNRDITSNKIMGLKDQFKSNARRNDALLHSKLKNFMEIQNKTCKFKVYNNKFASGSKIIAFERIHEIEKPFECNICNEKFIASSSLEVHLRNHTLDVRKKQPIQEKVYVLKIWNKDPVSVDAPMKYLKSHNRKKPNSDFRTRISKIIKSYAEGRQRKHTMSYKRFQKKYGWKEHQQIFSTEKLYQFQKSDTTLQTDYVIKEDGTIHKKEKRRTCDMCGKTFIRSYLQIHKRLHTGEKPYVCQVCNKKFRSKTAQNRHQITHTTEKPFECGICNMKFKLKDQLKQHQVKHSREKPFECSVCKKGFKQMFGLKAHLRTHTKLFDCELCNEGFATKYDLKIHKAEHSGKTLFGCDVCEKKFLAMRYLKQHLRIHREKSYTCNVCDKKFLLEKTLLLHKTIHTGEKPFACDMCSKTFSFRCNLLTHKKRHARKAI